MGRRTLKNHKHELFAQQIAAGAALPEAYAAAGFSKKGARGSAFRLQQNAAIMQRVSELTQTVGKTVAEVLEAEVVKRIVAERIHRLDAIQSRWDKVHEAIEARAKGDYKAMMATGLVVRKLKSIRNEDGKSFRVVEEFEFDHAVIESLNSIERRAAIETGQEVDRADIKLRGNTTDQAEILQKTFTFEELRVMQDRMRATVEAERSGKTIAAPALPSKEQSSAEGAATSPPDVASSEEKRPSWRD